MITLVEFLRARIAEDEKTARAAAEVCGCHPAAPSWIYDDEDTDGRILIVGDPHPDMKRKLTRRWGHTYAGLFAARHITRFDPARALAEVAAKRQIIEAHHPAKDHNDLICAECSHGLGEYYTVPHPCLTLRLLALPHADHPDYRDEWRP